MAGPVKIAILADARQAQAAFLRVSAGADSMGAKMARTGSKLTRSLTLPIVAVGAASIKMSTDFNSAMTRIQTQAGASAHDVQVLSKQVLDLAGKTQQGPEQLAESLYHLKSVGLDNVKAMRALAESSKFAAVGNANLEDTTNALAGTWRSGIRGARSFHNAVGTLNAVIGAGNQTMADLNDAIGTGFLPSARSFGLSLKSVGAALALMTDEGIPASVAATRLRMSFSLLGAPSDKAAGYLAQIGIKSKQLGRDMRSGGLVKAIGDLKDHLSSLNKVQQAFILSKAFGGGRSSSAILTLLNNYDVLVKKQQQIVHTSNNVGKAIAAQAKTPQAQFKLLESTVEVLAIKLGDVLLPDAIKAAHGLNQLLTKAESLPGPLKAAAKYATLFAAAAGPLLLVGGTLSRSVLSIGKLGSVIAGRSALGGLGRGVVPVFVTNKGFGAGGDGGLLKTLGRDAEKGAPAAAGLSVADVGVAAAGALTAIGITGAAVFAAIQESKSGPGANAGGLTQAQWRAFNNQRLSTPTGLGSGAPQVANMKALATAADAVRANAAAASRSLDLIGPHGEQAAKRAVPAIQRLGNEALNSTQADAVRASQSIEQIGPHAEVAARRAQDSLGPLSKAFADIVKNTRPDFRAYQASLSRSIDQLGGIARNGGQNIGADLGAGVRTGLAGTLAGISSAAAAAVENAIESPRVSWRLG